MIVTMTRAETSTKSPLRSARGGMVYITPFERWAAVTILSVTLHDDLIAANFDRGSSAGLTSDGK